MNKYQIQLEKKIRKHLAEAALNKTRENLKFLFPKFASWLDQCCDQESHSKEWCSQIEEKMVKELKKYV